jgi:nucleotide-binding universal stress UspA family protein
MTEPTKPRIVVAIAEPQPATLRFAIDEALHFGYDLEVVHCAGYTHYAARVIDQIYFDNWIEAAEHVLDDAKASVARMPDPPRAHYRLSDHSPIDELLEVSTEAAEIVVGSDNPSWFSRMWGPAVAQSIVFTAVCPVVVVPEHVLTPPWAHGVVVGIEATHSEEHVLRYAFEHADHRGRKLQVLHALPFDASAGEIEAHEAAVAEVLAGWSEKYPDVAVTRRFVQGKAHRVCARATMSAELVVLGQPRGDRIPFGFDKPLSSALLQRARGPVAIVPDPLS